jgi:hypothetical protein
VEPDGTEKIDLPIAAGEPELLAAKHFLNTKVRNGSYLFTRAALEKVGRLDEGLMYNEDSDFFQRLALCCRAAYSRVPTVRHHFHPQNKSSNRTEIYRALHKSSQKILIENPAFAAELGSQAEARLRQIKGQWVESLLQAGKFDEAIPLAAEAADSLGLTARAALLLGTNLPLRVASALREAIRPLKKPFRKSYYRYQMRRYNARLLSAPRKKGS